MGMTQKQMSLKVDLEAQRQLLQGIGEEEDRERARLASLAPFFSCLALNEDFGSSRSKHTTKLILAARIPIETDILIL